MPKDASPLPVSGLWTWDHSTNWCGDPTKVESGCFNLYRKEPGSFLEDYTALLEYAGSRQIPYLMIAGLFRDSHGGEAAVTELLRIARSCDVKVLACVGVNSYAGFYWEGEHEWCLETWLHKHPELRAVVPDPPVRPAPGLHGLGIACPMREETVRWYENGTRWLLDNFDVGGLYLETGDYGLCQCDVCLARSDERRQSASEQAEERYINEAIAGRISHEDMALALPPVIETAYAVRPDTDVVYATYSGFDAAISENPPPFINTIPSKAICQWTLTDMPYPEPWGDPDLRPPAARNIGYSHRGSQWGAANTRHALAVRYIRETCRRAQMSGLEGVFIHGEMSPGDSFVTRMNYEAFAYFRRNPIAEYDEFATTILAEYFGGDDEAVEAVQWMTNPADAEELERRAAVARKRKNAMDGAASDSWESLGALQETALM
jgi:hypothetical protein